MSAPTAAPGLLLGAIADDFTGATDLASMLASGGVRCVQTIGVPDGPLHADGGGAPQAVVVALKSRTIGPADAVAQSLAALRWLQAQGARQIYFKYCSTFDSTPDGNIGPVTDALLDALHGAGQGLTIACPALPANGRSVYMGHLFVGEQLLSDSPMRHHPLTPMTDANLLRVLQPQTRRRVGLVPHAVVGQGPDAVRQRLLALARQGTGIAVCDAVDEADLRHLGAALADRPLVTAGSGLAIGLAAHWRTTGALPGGGDAAAAQRLPAVQGRCAVVSGSCSAATQAQVADAISRGLPTRALDPLALAAGRDVVGDTLAWAADLGAAGGADRPVLVYATAAPDQVRAVQAQLGTERAAQLVEQALAAIAHGLVRQGVRRLVVAGGETSGAVVQALGIGQLAIGAPIDPGVPWTAARAGAVGGAPLHLALKSGNFGGTDFFSRAFAPAPTP